MGSIIVWHPENILKVDIAEISMTMHVNGIIKLNGFKHQYKSVKTCHAERINIDNFRARTSNLQEGVVVAILVG